MDPEIVKRFFLTDTKKICENESLLRIRDWRVIKVEFPIFIISMLHPKSHREYYFSFLHVETTPTEPSTKALSLGDLGRAGMMAVP